MRLIPSRARWCGAAPETSTPSMRTVPAQRCTPDTALNIVVLPAPFGPIRPTISPASTRQADVTYGAMFAEPDVQVVRLERCHRPLPLGRALLRAPAVPRPVAGGPGDVPASCRRASLTATVSQWLKNSRAPIVDRATPRSPPEMRYGTCSSTSVELAAPSHPSTTAQIPEVINVADAMRRSRGWLRIESRARSRPTAPPARRASRSSIVEPPVRIDWTSASLSAAGSASASVTASLVIVAPMGSLPRRWPTARRLPGPGDRR